MRRPCQTSVMELFLEWLTLFGKISIKDLLHSSKYVFGMKQFKFPNINQLKSNQIINLKYKAYASGTDAIICIILLTKTPPKVIS